MKHHEQGRIMATNYANNSFITSKAAAEASGFSMRHIQKLITSGKLSATRDDGKNYLINKAEFYRVFPTAHIKEQTRTHANNDDNSSRTDLEVEVRYLHAMLAEKDKQNGLLNKQNEFMSQQLEAATIEKAALLDTINSNQKLLEHQETKRKKRRFFGLF